MEILINGESHTVGEVTVGELLSSLGLDPARLAVERNREIVPKREYDSTRLADGDRLEIVQFVGGG